MLEGLAVALANIDDFIAIIRNAPTPPVAKAELMLRPWDSSLVREMLTRTRADGGIVNADDYGHCAEINAAVEQLVEKQRLRDVSVLVNGQCLDSAVQFLLDNPQVSVGVHLNAVEGLPVSTAVEVELK